MTISMNEFENGLRRYLSLDQIQHIQSLKIGIGGAGGLGSNIAMILVRSGFKHLEILDKDTIDASNLNRQQYFIDEIGRSKIDVTRQRLLNINPDLSLTLHHTSWTSENASPFFTNTDVIVEAFDQADVKHQFVEYYHDKTKYIVSGNGMAGLLEKKPLAVRKAGNIYFVGDGVTDTAEGHPPMAPRVTMCAAMMAEIILDLVIKKSI